MHSSEILRLEQMSHWEKRLKAQGFSRIAGIDEAGRGPLSGPVVAAACILPEELLLEHLNDSKQLTPPLRELLFAQITAASIYGIGIVDVETIDRINILQATLLAMRQAVAAMPIQPDYLLIDGNRAPRFSIPHQTIVQGDTLSLSIAAASVLAKVTRDRILLDHDARWPEYGFKRHKGYGTAQHLAALQKHGPCEQHRKSFEPIKSLLGCK